MISVHFQGKLFNITKIQVYALTTDTKEAEVDQFCGDLQNHLELASEKDVLFIIGDWNVKVGSRGIPGVTGKAGPGVSTKSSRAKANRILPRECTGHSKHSFPTTQEITFHTDITNGQHQNQTDCILCSQRWRRSVQSAKTRAGGDCGSDHELRTAKSRLIMKEVGKITRPFRYDLNQIPMIIQWRRWVNSRD